MDYEREQYELELERKRQEEREFETRQNEDYIEELNEQWANSLAQPRVYFERQSNGDYRITVGDVTLTCIPRWRVEYAIPMMCEEQAS